MTAPNKLQALLTQHKACKEAKKWARKFKTPAQAWDACDNPEWLLWAIDRLPPDICKIRQFACWYLRQVWHLLTDDRSKKAVEVAESFAEGKTTVEELNSAYFAAMDAAWTTISAKTKYLAWAAAEVAAKNPNWKTPWSVVDDTTRNTQIAKIKELWGNPFRQKASKKKTA